VIVNGAVDTPLKLTVRDLRAQFQKVRVVAAMQVSLSLYIIWAVK
jgi:hypothetical protein